MKDFPVDIVYTWVDGLDEKWLLKKNAALDKYNYFHKSSDVSGNKRFVNKDELKFSLRSIEKFCPWVRNIYLVTDNQIPKWLNQNNKQIIIIDHKDLFDDKKCLPTFNSHAIEMRLHHIKNLSNNFLSFNDDQFIGRLCTKEDFFYKENHPKLYMGKRKSRLKLRLIMKYPKLKKLTPHQFGLLNSRQLILKNYNKLINYDLAHIAKILNKNILHELEAQFLKSFNITLKNQFRDPKDTWIMSLHAYYLIAKGLSTPYHTCGVSKRNYINKFYSLSGIKSEYGYIRLTDSINKIKKQAFLIEKYRPLSFCLNDWPNDNKEVDQIIMSLLISLFPKKSKYEK